MVHIKRSDHMEETEETAQGSFPVVSSFSAESTALSGKAGAPCQGLAVPPLSMVTALLCLRAGLLFSVWSSLELITKWL